LRATYDLDHIFLQFSFLQSLPISSLNFPRIKKCRKKKHWKGGSMMTNSFKLVCCCVALLVLCAIAVPLHAETAKELFEEECGSCHSIGGGPLVGPDLMGITAKKDRAWLIAFIMNPQAMLDKGDAYALKIYKEWDETDMPDFGEMGKDQIESLLVYIESQSGGAAAQAAPAAKITFSEEDVSKGMTMFVGTQQLKNGGAACISCHASSSIKSPVGGSLGPDLTKVAERLGGGRGLIGWMKSPPSKTMRPIYKKRPLEEDEVRALVAFLVSEKEHEVQSAGVLKFFGTGIIGAAVLLVLSALIWGKRFRAVRSPLVEG
jgi:mono/diheme cytochrome c family protein